MSVQEIMSSIDAIKGKLTDGEYKELCDKMMELKRVDDKKQFPVKIWFMTASSYITLNYYSIDSVSRIVMMNDTEFRVHKKNIETFATHVSHYNFNKPHMTNVFTHNRLNYYHLCDCGENECGAINPTDEGYCVEIYHLQKMEELVSK